jgi:hypothetical protein
MRKFAKEKKKKKNAGYNKVGWEEDRDRVL